MTPDDAKHPPPDSAGEYFGRPAVMRMIVQIADPHDPSLTVEFPG